MFKHIVEFLNLILPDSSLWCYGISYSGMDTKDDPMDEQTKDTSERAYEEFEKFRRTINNNWNSDANAKACGDNLMARESETDKPSTNAVRGGDNIDK